MPSIMKIVVLIFGTITINFSCQVLSENICLVDSKKNEVHVLVLYTGGTIGMMAQNSSEGLIPVKNAFANKIRKTPELHDEKYKFNDTSVNSKHTTLVLPAIQRTNRRVIYTIIEYENLIDSSNIKSSEWIKIASDIKDNYNKYNSFVILHGTDTLAYTASMLSFMFENLNKTVIVTGSQVPIFEKITDGLDNFLNSLIIAGNFHIPEVTVAFNGKLFRGNRVLKVNSMDFNAFDSPNLKPLMKICRKIDDKKYKKCKLSRKVDDLKVHLKVNDNVAIVKIFPNMRAEMLRGILSEKTEGVVLESYGAGNMPKSNDALMNELKNASDRGIIIINVSQCIKGGVIELYETGKLSKFGVINGHDMTYVSAFAKLSYVLGKRTWNLTQRKDKVQANLRGELTIKNESHSRSDNSEVEMIEKYIRMGYN